jgi:hypothetical protein
MPMRTEDELYTVPFDEWTDDELRQDKSGIAADVLDRRKRGIREIDATEVHDLLVNVGVSEVRLEEGSLNADDYMGADLIFVLTDGRQVLVAGHEGLLVELIERPVRTWR